MSIAGYFIEKRVVTIFSILLIIAAGYLSYGNLGRLEDPQFTIKEALIITQYPGATSEEVEREVTEPLESAVQQLKQLEEVRSISRAGLSIVIAEMQDIYDKDTLPQVWDELRRKVGEAARSLPPGCQEPLVNDDFGDVYGIFFAVTGDGYSLDDLKEIAEDIRRELLLCEGVGRIDFWGVQPEVIHIEINRDKMAKLGISPAAISVVTQQNAVVSGGDVRVGSESIEMEVTGSFDDVKDLEEVLIPGGDGSMIRLKDIATVTRDYLDPPITIMYRDGEPAIGIGISTVSGGNVVTMGKAVNARLAELENWVPLGVEIDSISFQGETVDKAVHGFVINLFEAVAIVIVLLMIFMGIREGLIIGFILLLTILSTFLGMNLLGVNLQRISLGALIIALGMLVDNAIVVTESIVINIRKGMDHRSAIDKAVRETVWPLLGATIIAILAFAAISISKDVTGEFLGSLFTVIGLSLGLSWILAITITPFLCFHFLKKTNPADSEELYNSSFYKIYRSFLSICLKHRWLVSAAVIAMLVISGYGFGHVEKNFFPDSSRNQFMIDIWYPEGTHIQQTADGVQKITEDIRKLEGVEDVTGFIGSGTMRFILTYAPEMADSAYGFLLVSVDDYRNVPGMLDQMREQLESEYPEVTYNLSPFKFGPGGSSVEVRFSGRDSDVLRSLAEQASDILEAHPNAETVRSNWGNRVKTMQIQLAEARARELGVSRPDVANSLSVNFSGMAAGLYRDGDELLPMILRLPEDQRLGVENLDNTQILSSATGKFVPLQQVSDGVKLNWSDPVIHRLDRTRTVTVSCKHITGTADALLQDLMPKIEAIELPSGYEMEWGGEYESSRHANEKLMQKVPHTFVIMFFITVILFNTMRHAYIIFAGLPLAIIGVTAGLLISGQPFGFMATLGFLSLAGMLMKNEIVLLDQINLELKTGKTPFRAVIDAAVSRVRPVSMAAFTTVLGMVPLLWDPFFVSMAVTIMSGLTFATVLTLVVIPVLYTIMFRVKNEA